ncbi:galactokinase [Propionicimonas sp.]|uniref:galactokinase n=1 Tax=Propionicimonas sp. TaxID=1955623 RepID=UPI00184BD04A|nr:galactokinase [Propionicimonas sp.]MBU3975575.1 galactokinase [Actinomycetota bacterium]MBA3020021.1 galactokinase [Propionicimonas sp.]MBU3986276.1 galactokinase [Actinomycetota bacterium]MBU4007845.1 galactokinase [Actinomycetota bacterium]MBU4064103.1 galactokinase [Actinomycetota bacterium]
MTSSAAAEVFRSAFDREPVGFARGPGRVNLIGEHTDYNLGFVLPFAIDRELVAAFAPRTDRLVRLATDFEPGVVTASLDDLRGAGGWAAYPLGVAWALGEFGVELADQCGFDLAVVSTVPVGAGLSSSAAVETATLMALSSMWSLDLDRLTLAQVGQRAENVAVGAPTGVMDQAASLLGQPDSAVFLDCRSLEYQIVGLGLGAAELAVLVMDTHVKHEHATGGYGQRRAECEQGAAQLKVGSLREVGLDDLPAAQGVLNEVVFRRVRHIVTENQRVLDVVELLGTQGPASIGPVLDASHASMRDDFEISVPELDLAVEVARANGALGARMTGGGFGGSAIALVPQDRADAIGAAVVEAFSEAGYAQPGLFVVHPVAGACPLG